MSKTNIVYKGVLFEDSFENYLNKESISICQFLYFLCIDDIAKHVERTFYTNKDWHFRYNVSSMIKLFIVKCFRKLSYDKTISSLTEEEAILLSFLDENDQIILPSGGTLHHFVKYPRFPPTHNEVGGFTPRSWYSCFCFSSISPTLSDLPGCSKHSMTSSLSNKLGSV